MELYKYKKYKQKYLSLKKIKKGGSIKHYKIEKVNLNHFLKSFTNIDHEKIIEIETYYKKNDKNTIDLHISNIKNTDNKIENLMKILSNVVNVNEGCDKNDFCINIYYDVDEKNINMDKKNINMDKKNININYDGLSELFNDI